MNYLLYFVAFATIGLTESRKQLPFAVHELTAQRLREAADQAETEDALAVISTSDSADLESLRALCQSTLTLAGLSVYATELETPLVKAAR